MNETDLSLLKLLQQDARLSNAELARRVKLSPPAVHARIRRLEERGFVERYAATLNHEKLGFDILSYVQIELSGHQAEQVSQIHNDLKAMPEVLECHCVTGDFDILLKVLVRNRQELHEFITDRLVHIESIARINTSVVLKEIKSSTQINLD